MKIIELLCSLRNAREARDELIRAFNDASLFTKEEKEAVETALTAEKLRITREVFRLVQEGTSTLKKGGNDVRRK